MKKLLFLLLFPLTVYAGTLTKADVYKTGPITFLGIDYRFVEITDQTISQQDLLTKYIPDWNDIVLREKDKFDFNKALHRGNVIFANDVAAKVNSKIDRDLHSKSELQESQINNISQDYDLNGKAGVGFILVMRKMDKNEKEASAYAVFIDMASRDILDVRKVSGKPGGFGVRNYWANALGNILEDMHGNWQKWRKETLGS